MRARSPVVLALLLAATNCSFLLDAGKTRPCDADGHCLTGFRCVSGVCVTDGSGGAGGIGTGGEGGLGGQGGDGCDGVICAAPTLCFQGQCLDPTCAAITCATDESCVGGQCYANQCASTTCASGAVCVGTACVDKRCAGVGCPTDQTCAGGVCLPTACPSGACAAGEVCSGSQCVNFGCDGLTCGTGLRCLNGACVSCALSEVSCTDGVDDDCDGKIDCADSDCDAHACTDKNECTVGETCAGGVCAGGTTTSCNAPPGACLRSPGTCDTSKGRCVYDTVDAGAACDDGNKCTTGETCGSGACTGGMAKVCNTAPPGGCYQPVGTCSATTGACVYAPLAAGTACNDGDACTTGDACDGKGACQGTAKACNSPPNSCHNAPGTCSGGTCTYSIKAANTACSDGNNCTEGDKCDGAGNCIAGPSCPWIYGTCYNRACSGGNCVQSSYRGEGTSCAFPAPNRCCGGACIDVSIDKNNCGGCGLVCKNGFGCERASATNTCSLAPAWTGRCICASGSECPAGQICRSGQPTYNNRCTPSGGGCAPGQAIQMLNQCPDYCYYP